MIIDAKVRCLSEICKTINEGIYEEWLTKHYPIVYEFYYEGQYLQAEIEFYGKTEDYVQVGVTVYGDGGNADDATPTVSCIVERKAFS